MPSSICHVECVFLSPDYRHLFIKYFFKFSNNPGKYQFEKLRQFVGSICQKLQNPQYMEGLGLLDLSFWSIIMGCGAEAQSSWELFLVAVVNGIPNHDSQFSPVFSPPQQVLSLKQVPSLLSGFLKYIHVFVTMHGLPRWFSGKESACQCRRLRRHGFEL